MRIDSNGGEGDESRKVLNSLDEEAEAANRREVKGERQGGEGHRRKQKLQHFLASTLKA